MTVKRNTIATHLAVFVLGVLAGAAWHPCTVVTTKPVEPSPPDEPASADSTGP